VIMKTAADEIASAQRAVLFSFKTDMGSFPPRKSVVSTAHAAPPEGCLASGAPPKTFP
jgi:hypothetical protein